LLTLQSTNVMGLMHDLRDGRRAMLDCVFRCDSTTNAYLESVLPHAAWLRPLRISAGARDLHDLAPLPKEELLALKRSVAELRAIGRNLNQMAKAAMPAFGAAPDADDLRAMLKVL